MTKRAAIYARVSTDEQAETGYGLLYQIERCKEYAERQGYILPIDPITDDYTGKTAFRPGMNTLLAVLATREIEVVIVHRTDRLGRRASVQDMLEAEIEAHGAQIEYVVATYDRSTPAGRAMRRMQGVFDQFDCENITERMREHRVEAAKRGSVMTTRAPYGYQVVKAKDATGKKIPHLEIVEEEARIVRMIYEWYAYGDETGKPLSIIEIVRRLTKMRVPTRHDTAGLARRKHPVGTWSEQTVYRMLHEETYIGRWYYRRRRRVLTSGDTSRMELQPRDQWIAIAIPAIVTEDTWQLVQERFVHNKERAKRNRKYSYLFSGMLRCTHCNATFTGVQGNRNPYYRCRYYTQHINRCTLPLFSESHLDRAVWAWITQIVSDPGYVEATLAERQQKADEENARLHELVATTDKLIAEKQAEQARVMNLYKRGLLDEDRWYLEDAACQQDIIGYEVQRASLVAQLNDVTYTPEYLADVRTACQRIATGLNHFTRDEKRTTYELLNLRMRLAVEDGMKVAYAECVLDTQRLLVTNPIAFRSFW